MKLKSNHEMEIFVANGLTRLQNRNGASVEVRLSTCTAALLCGRHGGPAERCLFGVGDFSTQVFVVVMATCLVVPCHQNVIPNFRFTLMLSGLYHNFYFSLLKCSLCVGYMESHPHVP